MPPCFKTASQVQPWPPRERRRGTERARTASRKAWDGRAFRLNYMIKSRPKIRPRPTDPGVHLTLGVHAPSTHTYTSALTLLSLVSQKIYTPQCAKRQNPNERAKTRETERTERLCLVRPSDPHGRHKQARRVQTRPPQSVREPRTSRGVVYRDRGTSRGTGRCP
jgi:hypothetical protein